MLNNILKLGLLSISMLFLQSCSEDINDLSDTLYIRHKGADMPAHIYGNGSEKVFLIILHGGPGGSGIVYRFGSIRDRIEKTCAVVYYDQRGSGMSQGRYSESDVNIDKMTEDVVALVNVIKHKYGEDSRFFLMGHSWGGTLGTATLLKDNNQDLFKGWIDLDGVHDWNYLYFQYIANFNTVSVEQIALENNVEFWQNVLTITNRVDKVNSNLEDSLDMNREAHQSESKLLDDGFINGDNEFTGTINNSIFKNNLLTTLWSGSTVSNVLINDEIIKNWSFRDRLNEIEIPSLFLWGKYDMIVPLSMGQDAYNNIGSNNKELVIFEESGHTPPSNEPDKFADVVIEFINSNK